jgi:hypothetical protein
MTLFDKAAEELGLQEVEIEGMGSFRVDKPIRSSEVFRVLQELKEAYEPVTVKKDTLMVELSQFVVAKILADYAKYDEDGDLIVDGDEYDNIVVEATLVNKEDES